MVKDFKLVVFETPQSKYYFDRQQKNEYYKDIIKGKLVVKKTVDEKKNKLLVAHYTGIDLGARLRVLWYISAFLLLTGAVTLLSGLSPTIFYWSLYSGLILILLTSLINSPVLFYLAAIAGLRQSGYKGTVRLRY